MESIQRYLQTFPFLVVKDEKMFSSCCQKNLTAKPSNIEKHLKTKKHIGREGSKMTQQDFNIDLTNFMIASNIPR
jgi:hypothetical protein